MSSPSPDLVRAAAALRQISQGLASLADALSGAPDRSDEGRYRRVLAEWGRQGLTRGEASVLLRKHGFAPQAAGGWVRGGWLEVHDDGRRYLTGRSLRWLSEQEEDDEH